MPKRIISRKEPYINIPKRTYLCQEYISLPLSSKAVYTAFLCEFRTDQPDKEIKLSYSQIRMKTGIKNDNCVSNALKQLIKKEFIFCCFKGGLEKRTNTYKLNKKYINLLNLNYQK